MLTAAIVSTALGLAACSSSSATPKGSAKYCSYVSDYSAAAKKAVALQGKATSLDPAQRAELSSLAAEAVADYKGAAATAPTSTIAKEFTSLVALTDKVEAFSGGLITPAEQKILSEQQAALQTVLSDKSITGACAKAS